MAVAVLQVLLLPIHLTLSWLYLKVRGDAPVQRWRRFDLGVLLVAFLAWPAAVILGYRMGPEEAPIWSVVYATAGGYLAFNAVLWGGWVLRRLGTRGVQST